MLRALNPREPVYCIRPQRYRDAAAEFLQGFPGLVLYAVKANAHPLVLRCLYDGGIRHFDCASVPEIAAVHEQCPEATCYFMVPVRLRGAAAEAQERFGVRHFMVDHENGLQQLADEIRLEQCTVFVRMAVHHESAMQDLSSKFGAPPSRVPPLLDAIRERGAEPALAFNVGSGVTSPDAYRYALDLARDVLDTVGQRVRLIDIGGGYPRAYPGFDVPPLSEYFAVVRNALPDMPLTEGGQLLAEPGRALAAPGLSAVVEVLLRRDDRLYLNDGMYGIFWELRFKGYKQYSAQVYRGDAAIGGESRAFRLYGPTCDSTDVLPEPMQLPADIRAGDRIEFSNIGAYSLSGRTDFNGHYSDRIVIVDS